MYRNQFKIATISCMTVFCFFLFSQVQKQNSEIAGFKKSDLQAVLHLTGVSYDGTVKGLVDATQKAWLRPTGKERWEMEAIFEEKRNELLPLFKAMGLIDAWKQHASEYRYVFIMGATVPRIAGRLQTLQELLKTPFSYEQIVFLSGGRLLIDSEKEYLQKRGWKAIPSTEAGVYPELFSEYGMPVEKSTCINAPQYVDQNGQLRRPGTAETIDAWLATNPEPGPILMISCQPFCHYQQVVVQSLLPQEYVLATVGEQAPDGRPVAVYLDTIARTIYQWAQTLTQKK